MPSVLQAASQRVDVLDPCRLSPNKVPVQGRGMGDLGGVRPISGNWVLYQSREGRGDRLRIISRGGTGGEFAPAFYTLEDVYSD